MNSFGYSGSCACGRIKVQTSSTPHKVVYCYCRECAQVSGAGFLPFGQFPTSDVTWSGQPDVWKSSKFAERGFCAVCATSLFMMYTGQVDQISLVLGMLETKKGQALQTDHHMFVGEKAGWVVIPDDGKDRFMAHTPEFQEVLDSWEFEILKKAEV